MPYTTVREVRQHIDKTVQEDDPVIKALILAAGNAIDRFTGHYQQDGDGNDIEAFLAPTTATTKIYAGSGLAHQWIEECVEITAVAVKDSVTSATYTAWTAGTDWIAFSGPAADPNFNRIPYTGLLLAANSSYGIFTSGSFNGPAGFPPGNLDRQRATPTVQVTARWGHSITTPEEITTACIMQTARWYKRLQGAQDITLASDDFGTILYRQVLDADVKMILVNSRYYKPAIGRR